MIFHFQYSAVFHFSYSHLFSIYRPYQCADCGKSYKDSASFKRHRLGHTGERPYACDLCEETFIDSKAVRRHRELAHPGHELRFAAEDEEEVDDDEEQAEASFASSEVTPSTSAYSSFESAEGKAADKENEEEIEVDLEMAEDEDDS